MMTLRLFSTRAIARSLFLGLLLTMLAVSAILAPHQSAQASAHLNDRIDAALSGTVVTEGGDFVSGATLQLFVRGSGQPRAGTVTDAEGRFRFDQVGPGQYSLFVSHVAFGSRSIAVSIDSDQVDLTIQMRSGVMAHEEVVVSSGRAREGLTPVTVTNISKAELDRQPDMKDLPVHLARQPAITWSSENGNAIGYSTLRMRGFGQRRLAVAINGIPQNDPEEFNVFWINFFDIQGAVQDIQIQRGAGSSVYGPTAIGGAINLRAMPYLPDFHAMAQVGAGAFGTRRFTAEVNSGLLADRWIAFGRLSRLESDGYRDWSWSEFWRFFAGVTRYGDSNSLTIQAYGGPQKDGLAYSGIPKAANETAIDDGFGGTIDRKYNFSAFDRDVENFHQPHVELHHEWDIRDGLSFNQSLFWVKGEGYFDFGGTFRSADYLRLPDGTVAPGEEALPLFLSRPDLTVLFRAYLDQWQVGWMPSMTWQDEVSTTTVGAEARLHRSLRWGRVQESNGLPSSVVGSDANARVYSFNGEKAIASLYGSHLRRWDNRWAVQGDFQATWRQYRVYDEAFFGTSFSKPFVFFNPRIGVTWRPEQPFSAFGSIALASREPRMKTLYDGEEAGNGFEPRFETDASGNLDTDNPLVEPEHLLDLESGIRLSREDWKLAAGAFWMEFQDEIVPSGGLDQYGVPRTGNAERTRHIGLEFDGEWRPALAVTVSANATFSRNRFIDFEEFVFTGASTERLDRAGNTIAGFPSRSGNLGVDWRRGPFSLSVMSSWVGEQFVDNGNGRNAAGEQMDDLVVDAFMLIDSSVRWSMQKRHRIEVSLDINNILNDQVLTYGNVSVVGPQFFPAATRHLFLSTKLTLR
jgi:iron complex outermembrane receptor protein